MLEIHPTPSRTTIFGTHGPGDLELDTHTTTPHRTTDGYPHHPAKFDLEVTQIPGVKNPVVDVLSHRPDVRWELCHPLALEVSMAGEWIEDFKVGIIDNQCFGPTAHSLANPSPCPLPTTTSAKQHKLWD